MGGSTPIHVAVATSTNANGTLALLLSAVLLLKISSILVVQRCN